MSTVVKNESKITYNEFLNPDSVFIPLYDDYDLLITNNDYVYKGQALEQKNNEYIYSPVSGRIIGAKTCVFSDNKKRQCIVILNDYKEKTKKRIGKKRLDRSYKLNDIIDVLQKQNAISMSEVGVKLWEIIFNAPVLLINAIELDENIFTNSFIFTHHMSDILDTIDFLGDIIGAKNIILAIANSDTENIANLSEFLGTYPKIKLKIMNGKYPMGLKRVLKSELFPRIEPNNIVFLGLADILAIYSVIVRNKVVSERYITITGNAIVSPSVIYTKIGALVKPIIASFVKLNISDSIYITNSLIGGNNVDIDELVVTHDLSAVIINTPKENTVKSCINCGKCHEVCPVKLNPKYIMENIDNPDKMQKAKKDKCINCGLCTNICSANINLKEYLNK